MKNEKNNLATKFVKNTYYNTVTKRVLSPLFSASAPLLWTWQTFDQVLSYVKEYHESTVDPKVILTPKDCFPKGVLLLFPCLTIKLKLLALVSRWEITYLLFIWQLKFLPSS